MKIRGSEELVDFIGARKQIRKRELVSLAEDLNPRGANPPTLVCRIAVVMAYAHWEGFVKEAASCYLHLVTHKTRSLGSLAQNFQALACRQELATGQNATKRIGPHIAIVKRLTDDISNSVRLDPDTAIDTESNLNSKVFENICDSLGIDYKGTWSTSGPFIDDLFTTRCGLAHGEIFTPAPDIAAEFVRFTLGALDTFGAQVENAAILQAYLREEAAVAD